MKQCEVCEGQKLVKCQACDGTGVEPSGAPTAEALRGMMLMQVVKLHRGERWVLPGRELFRRFADLEERLALAEAENELSRALLTGSGHGVVFKNSRIGHTMRNRYAKIREVES